MTASHAGGTAEIATRPEDAAGDTGVGRDVQPGATIRPQTRSGAVSGEPVRTVLIAALGGEGGGVLSNWLVDAALADGRTVQATSVPGVAQRTGATTYYLEIGPRIPGNANPGSPSAEGSEQVAANSPGVPRPVLALLPTPGNVDLLVASELLEAGRAAQQGMITPDRTTVIASTHRTFAIGEKSAMGDGRFHDGRVRRAVQELSRRHVLADLGAVAERVGTFLSSVLLGTVAGSGALPIPGEQLRASIERAGIAVDSNLRGFDAGVELVRRAASKAPQQRAAANRDVASAGNAGGKSPVRLPKTLAPRLESLPGPVREIARLGVERTLDFQDLRYARQYLDRVEHMLREGPRAGSRRTGQHPEARVSPESDSPREVPFDNEGSLEAVREAARHLAVWMCFEDIIRVADLKTRRSRMDRVRAEVRAKPDQPVVITEFLKPGVDEWCSLFPAWLGGIVRRAADRGGWRHRFKLGLRLRSSSVSGYLMLWMLARLRFLRRGMSRYREEQDRIESWLARVQEAFSTSPALALETAKCANLVKGYGETRERGIRSFERTLACLEMCAGTPEPDSSLRALREAALADPEGARLEAAISALRTAAPGGGPTHGET